MAAVMERTVFNTLDLVQGIHPSEHIAGFKLRTTVHGTEMVYGSLEMESAPTLIITLK
jgi:hypothetical protein